MSCDFDPSCLEAYALGLLESAEKASVAEHVKNCQKCQRVVVQHSQAMQCLEQAFQEQPSEMLVQRTRAGMRRKTSEYKIRLHWGAPVLAGAATLVLVLVMQPNWLLSPQKKSVDVIKEGPAAYLRLEAGAAGVRKSRLRIEPAAFSAMDDLDQQLANPTHDQSIYKDLGVAAEVAKLLL